MLENKRIVVGEEEYRLTIKRKLARTGRFYFYKAYLSDINSQFTTEKTFHNLTELKDDLRNWIIRANHMNDPEERLFEDLRRWDGVIEV